MKTRNPKYSAMAVLLVATVVAGCTYQAVTPPTATPAAEVLPQRVIDGTASLYFDPGLGGLRRDAETGYACSAHSFPVSAGTAVTETLRTANEASFSNIVDGTESTKTAPDADRHIVFSLEQFRPRLEFASGFWSARAIANVDLVLRVRVLDAQDNEILRTMISGNGFGEDTGDCEAGARALARATEMAIGRAAENYVYRVINSSEIALTPEEAAASAALTQ